MPLKSSGIGQRTLQRAPLAGESFGKRVVRHAEHLESARVVVVERLLARHHVERGAFLRSRLGQDQRAVRKVERGEAHAARERSAGGLPAQPPRDHQVQHQEASVRRTRRRSACRCVAAGGRPRRGATSAADPPSARGTGSPASRVRGVVRPRATRARAGRARCPAARACVLGTVPKWISIGDSPQCPQLDLDWGQSPVSATGSRLGTVPRRTVHRATGSRLGTVPGDCPQERFRLGTVPSVSSTHEAHRDRLPGADDNCGRAGAARRLAAGADDRRRRGRRPRRRARAAGTRRQHQQRHDEPRRRAAGRRRLQRATAHAGLHHALGRRRAVQSGGPPGGRARPPGAARTAHRPPRHRVRSRQPVPAFRAPDADHRARARHHRHERRRRHHRLGAEGARPRAACSTVSRSPSS